MTVKELAKKAGIGSTTIYSIIQRDTSIRFDTALRISNILISRLILYTRIIPMTTSKLYQHFHLTVKNEILTAIKIAIYQIALLVS